MEITPKKKNETLNLYIHYSGGEDQIPTLRRQGSTNLDMV